MRNIKGVQVRGKYTLEFKLEVVRLFKGGQKEAVRPGCRGSSHTFVGEDGCRQPSGRGVGQKRQQDARLG